METSSAGSYQDTAKGTTGMGAKTSFPLDTNAIIYYLKDDAAAVSVLRNIFSKEVPLYVSSITEVELLGFPHLTTNEEEQIETPLKTVAVIPLDSRLARIAGAIRRERSALSRKQFKATSGFR